MIVARIVIKDVVLNECLKTMVIRKRINLMAYNSPMMIMMIKIIAAQVDHPVRKMMIMIVVSKMVLDK